ncbi:MAG: NUDIX hydrolase [Pseudomonadota bacterium]
MIDRNDMPTTIVQRPMIGVGAVVFRGNDVLLVKRGKPPFEGQWSIPGGRLEFGETLQSAAKREVFEETGVDVEIVDMLGVFEALPDHISNSESSDQSNEKRDDKSDMPAHVVLVDYIGLWVKGDVLAGDDAAEAEFVPYENALSRVAWDETRRAVEMAWRVRARLTAQ